MTSQTGAKEKARQRNTDEKGMHASVRSERSVRKTKANQMTQANFKFSHPYAFPSYSHNYASCPIQLCPSDCNQTKRAMNNRPYSLFLVMCRH
jgi:hypothetical protein